MLTQGCRRPQRIHVADGVDLDASNANMFRVDAGAPLRAPTACTPPDLHPPSRVALDSAVAKRLEGLATRRPIAAKQAARGVDEAAKRFEASRVCAIGRLSN
jgi:hypothetical protein